MKYIILILFTSIIMIFLLLPKDYDPNISKTTYPQDKSILIENQNNCTIKEEIHEVDKNFQPLIIVNCKK